ncbi:MAG: phosphate transport system regulatory protein PhoU [Armatimonadetes bacterium]|nr:phosphate transport system regulatory protein PhoU [Armatimonadota bacterium]
MSAMPEAARKHFDELLEGLKAQVMEMRGLVDKMVADSVKAVVRHDYALARQVLERDNQVDSLELEVHSTCIAIIAREAPVAKDVRFLTSAMAIAIELERVGDHAVSIAKKALSVPGEFPSGFAAELLRMADRVRAMLTGALRAFATGEVSALEEIVAADNEVDVTWKEARRRIKEAIRQDLEMLDAGYKLIQAFHQLEYIGDNAVAIAERIEFVRTGNVVRFSRAKF